MQELIDYKIDAGVAVLTINNGKANALSPELITRFEQCLEQAATEKAIVIITGQMGIFSAGYDLKVMLSSPEQAVNLVTSGSSLSLRMLAHPQPIIAACSGHAVAKGAFLLLSCDYRIGVTGDYKIALNEVKIGMTMHQAGLELARSRLSHAAFERAVNLAENFSPETAVNAGFLDQVVPQEQLLAAAMDKAMEFQQLNSSAHAQTKLKARRELLQRLEQAIEQDKSIQLSLG